MRHPPGHANWVIGDEPAAGVAAALAVSGLAGASVPVAAAIGVAVALVLAAAFLLHQERRLYRTMAEVPDCSSGEIGHAGLGTCHGRARY